MYKLKQEYANNYCVLVPFLYAFATVTNFLFHFLKKHVTLNWLETPFFFFSFTQTYT